MLAVVTMTVTVDSDERGAGMQRRDVCIHRQGRQGCPYPRLLLVPIGEARKYSFWGQGSTSTVGVEVLLLGARKHIHASPINVNRSYEDVAPYARLKTHPIPYFFPHFV